MAWFLSFVVVMSVGASLPAESGTVDPHPAEAESAESTESAKMPDSTALAQVNVGRILQGLRRDSDDQHEDRDEHEQGDIPHTTTPTTPDTPKTHKNKWKWDWKPMPPHSIQPQHPTRPQYVPTRPQYVPHQPQYAPFPNPIPGTTITPAPYTPVPSNVLPPVTPATPVEPETNVVLVVPKPNNFLDNLDFKPITPQQLGAFKKQLAQKNKQLGEDLKKLFPGNDKLIDQLVVSANKGQLTAKAVQQFIAALGGKPGLPLQLKASKFVKRLVFNNLAMRALFNVNLKLLNINININIVGGMGGGPWGGGPWGGPWGGGPWGGGPWGGGMGGGGPWGGFWGFPHWPWSHPIWLGPGMWWGPCGGCVMPYYNPYLNGAAVMGIPYSIVAPVVGYQGNLVANGILITNIGGSKVNYVIGGTRYSMKPNFRQVVARRRIVISFDRGGPFGRAKYSIDEGWYEFTPTDKGWELYQNTAKITIDNSDNPFAFNYVLNNRRRMLKPGYRQEHSSKYPLELKFSNGKGKTIQKILAEGDFKVAVGADGGLGLFKPEDVTMPAPIARMSRAAEKKTQNIFAQPESISNLFGDAAPPAAPPEPAKPDPATPSLFGP